MTATELRKNLYRILDQVIETGAAQEIERKGQKLLIVPATTRRYRFEDAPKHSICSCSFEELVESSWEKSWDRQA